MSTGPAGSHKRFDVPLLLNLYTVFALTGLLTALPGPLLPILLQRWRLTDAQGGAIVAAQFMAGLAGALVANRDRRLSLLVGVAAMAAGTFGLAFLPWPYLIAAIFGYGLGLGLAIPAINLTIAERNASSRAASLSLLNCVWGLGAVSATAVIFIAQKFSSVRTVLTLVSVLLGLLFLAALHLRQALGLESADSQQLMSMPRRPSGSLGLFGFLFFLYVGVETSIASWINVHLHRITPGMALSFAPGAYFWTGLLLGRLAAPRVLQQISDNVLYFSSLVVALVGLLPILLAQSAFVIDLGSILCGLALAPVFPLLISFAAPAMLARRNSGWVFACASLGGAILPWSVGVVSSGYDLRIALMIPAVAIALLFFAALRPAGPRQRNRLPA